MVRRNLRNNKGIMEMIGLLLLMLGVGVSTTFFTNTIVGSVTARHEFRQEFLDTSADFELMKTFYRSLLTVGSEEWRYDKVGTGAFCPDSYDTSTTETELKENYNSAIEKYNTDFKGYNGYDLPSVGSVEVTEDAGNLVIKVFPAKKFEQGGGGITLSSKEYFRIYVPASETC